MVQSHHTIFFLSLENLDFDTKLRKIPSKLNLVNSLNFSPDPDDPEKIKKMLPALKKIINDISPDLIHAGPVQTCGYLTALADFHPYIVMSWGSDILVDAAKNAYNHKITRFALDKADWILCDCDAVKNRSYQITNYDDKKIIQFPWGVDIQRFRPGPDVLNIRSKYGWNNCFVILSVRMWEPIYGIFTVLKSFNDAYRLNPNIRLILAGAGSQSDDINKFIQKNDLENVIVLPGIIENETLADFYRSADLYLSGSLSDGSSVSLLEALASGLPVVVTDSVGNREWIINEQNGFLSEINNEKDFADAINRMSVKSKHDLKRISETNRKLAEKRANWDKNIYKLLDIYDRIEKECQKKI
jgi:L-malate glycosyltransferase